MIEVYISKLLMEDSYIYNCLTENNYRIQKYSKKLLLYYRFIRKIIPIFIRHILQYHYSKKIQYLDNFIDEHLPQHLHKLNPNFLTSKSFYPDDYQSIVLLTHDVEGQKGYNYIPKVIELEEKYQFQSSWNLVANKYHIYPDIIRLIKEKKNEIGIHGYNHDGLLFSSEKIFTFRAKYINKAIANYEAYGFRAPMLHRDIHYLQQLDILYDSSFFDYDPFQPFPGGTGCIYPYKLGKFIELPITLPQDHTLFYILNQKNSKIWQAKTKWLIRNKGIINIITHPDYLLEKDHLKIYDEYLYHLSTLKNVKIMLPFELAEYWKRTHLSSKNSP